MTINKIFPYIRPDRKTTNAKQQADIMELTTADIVILSFDLFAFIVMILSYYRDEIKLFYQKHNKGNAMRKARIALSFIFAVLAIGSAYYLSVNGNSEDGLKLGLIFSFFSVMTIPDARVEV